MSVQERIGMPMEEFIRHYDQAPFDLIRGEKRMRSLKLAGQAEVQTRLLHHLFELKLSAQIFFDAPYVQLVDDQVVHALTSSILIYHHIRWAEYTSTMQDWLEKPFVLVPDFCVEDKVAEYLRDGVRLVWIVNPRAKSVAVYTAGSEQITRLTAGHTLTGGDVLPDFSIAVTSIFPT